jgi:hypothetical protein
LMANNNIYLGQAQSGRLVTFGGSATFSREIHR